MTRRAQYTIGQRKKNATAVEKKFNFQLIILKQKSKQKLGET